MRPYAFVLWNLFLAIIPVALAFLIARGVRHDRQGGGSVRWVLWGPLALVWLLFLPNSCYLLTEWRHYLDTLTGGPLYARALKGGDARFDFFVITGFYFFYSGAGLLAFFLAVWPLDRLTRPRLGRLGAVLRPLIFPLCGLGVYLGLMRGRFNTWNVLEAHRLTDLLNTVFHVFQRPHLILSILVFGAALWVLYILFDIWMDGLAWRLSHRNHHAREKDPSHAAS
jgi:uncharacterized membrane protein